MAEFLTTLTVVFGLSIICIGVIVLGARASDWLFARALKGRRK